MARYTTEMRERALRMLGEARADHPNQKTAIRHVAGLLGMSPETLRVRQRRYEVEAGARLGRGRGEPAAQTRERRVETRE